MKFSYFPGCTLKNKAIILDVYARKSAEALGVTLEEIEDWQCCGGVFTTANDEIATKLSSVRALKDRSPDKVEKTVGDIIEERMELEQFSECDITIADLMKIRMTIVNVLTGVYHHRVKYPKIKYKNKGGKKVGENE